MVMFGYASLKSASAACSAFIVESQPHTVSFAVISGCGVIAAPEVAAVPVTGAAAVVAVACSVIVVLVAGADAVVDVALVTGAVVAVVAALCPEVAVGATVVCVGVASPPHPPRSVVTSRKSVANFMNF
jgi:hypothetical protein